MTANPSNTRSLSNQRGVTLVITLIMLVAMMLMVSAGIRTNVIQERIASNTRAYQNAFLAAESALRHCERLLLPPAATLPSPIISETASGTPGSRWNATGPWSDVTQTLPVTLNSSDSTSSARCMMEEFTVAGDKGYYVTGRGVSAGGGEAYVQSILSLQ